MKLVEINLKNFMRFRKAKLSLCDKGMTLIEGENRDDASATSNGAGKSTLVDALVWCLYGVTTHEPSAQGDDVVNEKRNKNCEVSVEFEVADERYTVSRKRAWKKGGKAVQLSLSCAGKPLTKGTTKDTQATIDRLLGMGVATFRHACVFGQGRAYRFSRLTDSEKKAVLDEMLGSEVYARAGQQASDRLAQSERELAKAETTLARALESLQSASTRLAKLKAREEERRLRAKRERKAAQRDLETLKVKLAKLKAQEHKAPTKLVMAQARKEADDAADFYQSVKRQATQARSALAELETRRVRIVKLKETDCVTCKQRIKARHTKRQLAAIDEEIEKQNRADFLLAESVVGREAEVQATRARLKSVTEAFERAQDSARDAARLRDKIEFIEESRPNDVEMGSYKTMIGEERATVTRLKKKVRKLKAFVELRTGDVEQLRFWQQGFSAKGLRSLMLDSSLPYLNAKLDQYTNALTAGNIEVEFRTQRELKGGGMREDFHVHVSNKHGSTKYNMNSVGERAKIDIIVGLALQDMAASRSKVPVNVAFFDEVFDGLDPQGVDRVVQVLSQLDRESAFVISHNAELKTFFSKRITVIKERGESRLEAA